MAVQILKKRSKSDRTNVPLIFIHLGGRERWMEGKKDERARKTTLMSIHTFFTETCLSFGLNSAKIMVICLSLYNVPIKLQFIQARVYNKERKRVSNALYGPCNMCLESHAPGIQTLTNESARFK